MKYTILFLIVVIFFSCEKEDDNNQNTTNTSNTPSTFKYKVNGTLLTFNGSLADNSKEGSILKKVQITGSLFANGDVISNTNYGYSLQATKNYYYSDDGEPIIEIRIKSPTLSTTTYTNTSIHVASTYYPSESSYCGYCVISGQEFQLTITKIENGYADGTFSGKLKKSSTGFDLITEGEFANVRILQ